jgi:hypothetical protein
LWGQTEREKCKKSQTIIRRENERIVKEKEKEELILHPTTHNAFFNIYLPVLRCELKYLPWATLGKFVLIYGGQMEVLLKP